MSPSDVAQGIEQYTNQAGEVYVDVVRGAEYVVYDITGFVLGLLVFFIVLGMLLISALDICYITIPIFQDKIREERWDGSSGGNKFRIISSAARIAVEQASSNGQNPMTIYLKKRAFMYCLCGVMLFIAIVGSNTIVNIITNFVLNIIQGIQKANLLSPT